MLSSDRVEPPGRRRRRKARRNAASSDAAPRRLDSSEPWDVEAADALRRLYESDEGQLHKPHTGERAPRAQIEAGVAHAEKDRAWLETHLSDLAERLQASLARLNPDPSLSALNRQLEALEERFGRALERVAQRADVHGLRAIESHVLELAEHLEKTRERLEQIGTLEEEVRGLGQRLDAGDQQQVGALGKLLREYVGEWRESEQRTTSALHSLEEAVSRLGDTVDAMEASKPAPDLSFATLAFPDPGRARTGGDPLAQSPAAGGRGLAAKSYHSTLDAADYAPKTVAEELPGGASAHGGHGLPALQDEAIAWSPAAADASAAGPEAAEPELKAGIMAVRARLRRARMAPIEPGDAEDATPLASGEGAPEPTPGNRVRPRLLLLAGFALLAGGAGLLLHALTAPVSPRAIPARIEPAKQPSNAKPSLVDPIPQPADADGPAG
jgi:hypothetical protein